ncbi:MAG TPA: DNA-binding response regulator [Chloroflexi bacterium]|nr:DNA-binding response regulator [Chloroflexota bacterium]HBY09539.1 DNA-binding response regulator [Chloroflexota bacterium]
MKALVVDDDLALADVVSFTLRRAGFEVIAAHDGQTALERWQTESPDILILDLNLPKLDGLQVCQRVRAVSETPIIILSVRGAEDDIVRGLQIGADDYIVKPFSPRQLVARVEAVLRRTSDRQQSASGPLKVGDLLLDPARCEVQVGKQKSQHLTKLECKLLEALMINHEQVLTFEMLIDDIWGPVGGDRSMLKQLIYRLRRKVETDPSQPAYIVTVQGVGYILEN